MGSTRRHGSRVFAALLACVLAAVIVVAGLALAAPGGLDPTFSGDGKKTSSFGNGSAAEDEGKAVAIQANGRIVVVGNSDQPGSGTDFALARYTASGAHDPTFSGDGRKTTSFGPGFDEANDVAIQRDGCIVAVGQSHQGGGTGVDFALARYTNGALDLDFSGDGKRTAGFGNGNGWDEAEGVAIQADGRIVVVGKSSPNGTGAVASNLAIARFKPGGGADPTFSNDGRRVISLGLGLDVAEDVAIQPNGKIVVVGNSDSAGQPDIVVLRFNPNGNLDPSFSGDGRLRIQFGGGDFEEANAVAIQGKGKILIAGVAEAGGGSFAIVRLNPNGIPDQTFAGDGGRTIGFGPGFDEAAGVGIEPNGRIVLAGLSFLGGPSGTDFAIARLLANGATDNSFSGDGRKTVGFGDPSTLPIGGSNDDDDDGDGEEDNEDDNGEGMAVQSDGRIVVVGITHTGSAESDVGVARFND